MSIMLDGAWLLAGSLLDAKYPCRCHEHGRRSCRTHWCPCWGRTDIAGLPSGCCAVYWPGLAAVYRESR